MLSLFQLFGAFILFIWCGNGVPTPVFTTTPLTLYEVMPHSFTRCPKTVVLSITNSILDRCKAVRTASVLDFKSKHFCRPLNVTLTMKLKSRAKVSHFYFRKSCLVFSRFNVLTNYHHVHPRNHCNHL